MDYRYLAEKARDARRSLMLPHPRGEATDIEEAFFQLSKAFRGPSNDDLPDESGRVCVSKLKSLMKPEPGQTRMAKAAALSVDEQYELSSLVTELAYWAEDKCSESRGARA